MRCIEIAFIGEKYGFDDRLIETWDVLKLWINADSIKIFNRLIETWDVLK